MTTYSGTTGIETLRRKIHKKSNQLMQFSIEKITEVVIDSSPVGIEEYPSRTGAVLNDAGDFKNSWAVGVGQVNDVVRAADTSGSAAIASSIADSRQYDMHDHAYITNSTEHAGNVEYGWKDNPTYGWKAKDGYGVVANTTDTAVAVLASVALELSK